MYEIGLFLNDLSMHDSSRDLVLAGEQQSAELKLALEQVRCGRNHHLTAVSEPLLLHQLEREGERFAFNATIQRSKASHSVMLVHVALRLSVSLS